MQPPPTISFKTLGCRLNQAETEAIEARFRKRGFVVRRFGEPADLVIVNSCTVTRDADRDSRYAIRRASRQAKGRVIVTGCYAQMRPEEILKIEGVNLVVGNQDKGRLPEIVDGERAETAHSASVDLFSSTHTRALLKIQDGCDYRCSFCIIPEARGPARSLEFASIIHEAEGMVQRGFREIIITGVNIGTYCSDESGRPRRFADLVERLAGINGLARLRISSIEPNTVTDPLLRILKRSSVVCPHLHIPIQSACDRILASMKRKYRVARLIRLMEKIREQLPEASIGTDVIIGFPGETAAEFEQTARFIETQEFSYLHIFPFSPRDGTPAAKFADPVASTETRRRCQVLREIDQRLRQQFARRFVGRELPVLFEAPESGLQTGHTANFLTIRAPYEKDLRGEIRNVLLGELYDHQTVSGKVAAD